MSCCDPKKVEPVKKHTEGFIMTGLDTTGLIKREKLADNFVQYDYMSVKNIPNGKG